MSLSISHSTSSIGLSWLAASAPHSVKIPGGAVIARRYATCREELPTACERLQLNEQELTFSDYVLQVEEWLKVNARTTG